MHTRSVSTKSRNAMSEGDSCSYKRRQELYKQREAEKKASS